MGKKSHKNDEKFLSDPKPRHPKEWEQEWAIEIEPDDGLIFRYKVSLTDGMLRYGPDGLWWWRWSLASAQRKGQKELRRKRRKLERKRQAQLAISNKGATS